DFPPGSHPVVCKIKRQIFLSSWASGGPFPFARSVASFGGASTPAYVKTALHSKYRIPSPHPLSAARLPGREVPGRRMKAHFGEAAPTLRPRRPLFPNRTPLGPPSCRTKKQKNPATTV